MEPELSTCLWFDDQAQEAVDFYLSVFPDGRILETTHYGEAGPGPAGSVLTIAFEIAGHKLEALNGGPHFRFTEAVSLVVRCDTQDEVDLFWGALTADGGEASQCGWLKDRFGLSWQIVPTRLIELMSDPDAARAQRVTEAMLKMSKIDIAALEAAYGA